MKSDNNYRAIGDAAAGFQGVGLAGDVLIAEGAVPA